MKTTKFEDICKKKQYELKGFLKESLSKDYENIIDSDGYLLALGDIPVLLVAHMDTVHKQSPSLIKQEKDKKGNIKISSPQGIGGDDRCGVYMILETIKNHKCSILFTEDEEIGCVGAKKFKKSEDIKKLTDIKFIIELDRKNATDCVFYSCDNKKFHSFVEDNTGFKTAYGSYSDICEVSPELDVASVNLSCGYYNPHTLSEYVIFEEMENTIKAVDSLIKAECKDKFTYDKKEYNYNYGSSYGINNYYEKYWDDYERVVEEEPFSYGVYFVDDGLEKCYVAKGSSLEECIGKMLIDNSTICFDDIIDYEEVYNSYDEGEIYSEVDEEVSFSDEGGTE